MQKARRLTDENSVYFQMSCLLLHFVQKAKFPCSKKVRAILRSLFCFVCLYVRGEHAQKPKFVVFFRCHFFSEKKKFIRHFARFNFWHLSLAYILKYYPILHAVKR